MASSTSHLPTGLEENNNAPRFLLLRQALLFPARYFDQLLFVNTIDHSNSPTASPIHRNQICWCRYPGKRAETPAAIDFSGNSPGALSIVSDSVRPNEPVSL